MRFLKPATWLVLLIALSAACAAESLQDQINADCAASHNYRLARGTFQSAGLLLPPGCSLQGQGRGVSILKLAPSSAIAGKPFIAMSRGELRDMTIDGNEANQPPSTRQPGTSCVQLSNTSGATLSSLEIKNCVGAGVQGSGWNNVTFDSFTVSNYSKGNSNVGAIHLYPWAPSSNIRITAFTIDGSISHASGIKLSGTPANLLQGVFVGGGTLNVGDRGTDVSIGVELLACSDVSCGHGTDVTAIKNSQIVGVNITGENQTNHNIFGMTLGGIGGKATGNTIKNARLYCIEAIGSNLTVQYNHCDRSGRSTVDGNVVKSVAALDGNNISYNTYTNGVDKDAGDLYIITTASGPSITNVNFSNKKSTSPAGPMLFVWPDPSGNPITGTFSGNQVYGPPTKRQTAAFQFFSRAVSGSATNNSCTSWGPGGGFGCIYNDGRGSVRLAGNTSN